MPSIKEALSGTETQNWYSAIDAELSQIEKLGTWTIVETPPDVNIIPCRYVLRRKRGADGNIACYKARLVAKGFKQQFGVDYTETFAPTVRAASLRILLSIAASHGAAIEQADVKNAYLNSSLKENEIIYMQFPPFYHRFCNLPPEFEKLPDSKLACRLKRPLYGTKQGAHHWYEEVYTTFTDLGYTACQADVAVFYKVDGNNYTIVAVATDDFTIIGDSDKATTLIKRQLSEH